MKPNQSYFNKLFIFFHREIIMIDVDINKFLWSFSLVSHFLHFIHILRNNICMALGLNSPTSSSSSSSSSLPSSSPWITFKSPILLSQGISLSSKSMKYLSMDHINSFSMTISPKALPSFLQEEGSLSLEEHKKVDIEESFKNSSPKAEVGRLKVASKIKKRPTKLLVPDNFSALELGEVVNKQGQKEFEMEGKDCAMAGRRGRRDVMEDGYGVITDIMGDSSQAFFGVFDGHGGRAAVNFVTENLGKNIVTALKEVDEAENQSRNAIRKGYLVTDKEFLTQDICSGVCAATVLVKDAELYVANVGDCRVVMSKNGVATALTNDHRLDREDERVRIENLGGYVNCQNGVWRVQGSLAVSRAIGDQHLKQWVIPEPEIKKLELTSDCEFLVIASDGLWDKVSNQEAVDMVSKNNSLMESCKKLVDISSSRGNKDDITVMVVDLKNFKRHQG